MQVVSRTSNHTAQMKALIEQCRGLSLRTLIRFFFPHENFNLLGEQTADGRSPPSSQDFGLPEGLPVEA
jgi:hypothetical protein